MQFIEAFVADHPLWSMAAVMLLAGAMMVALIWLTEPRSSKKKGSNSS